MESKLNQNGFEIIEGVYSEKEVNEILQKKLNRIN